MIYKDLILNNKVYNNILKLHNVYDTQCIKMTYTADKNSSLIDDVYFIIKNNNILMILTTIFGRMATVTWEQDFSKCIFDMCNDLKKEGYNFLVNNFTINDINKITYTSIYSIDKNVDNKDEAYFIQLMNVNDFVSNGLKGKNGISNYFFFNNLPKFNYSKEEYNNIIFGKVLSVANDKDIYNIARQKALENYTKYYNKDNSRTEEKLINNITYGLFGEYKAYVDLCNELKNTEYSVILNEKQEDDQGIDIIVKNKNNYINIDVKTTTNNVLKISNIREKTHLYLIYKYNPNLKNQQYNIKKIGFVNKLDFWNNDFNSTEKPEIKNNMYFKPIETLNISNTINEAINLYEKYKKQIVINKKEKLQTEFM